MSAKVDVLAIMKRDAQAAADQLYPLAEISADEYMARLSESANAHDAVAELIAALEEMNRLAKGPPGGVSLSDKRAIVARVDAALAACTAARESQP